MENTDLYRIYQNYIYILAHKYMANREDAEDIVQEVLLRLWNHSSHIDKEKVGAWIRRVTRNACLDALHRRRSYRSVISVQDSELSLHNAQAIEKNLPQYIKAALSRLEEPYRTLILLRDIEGLSYKDICQELKMPLIDLCISNGMVPHSCFDPDRIPLAMQSSIIRSKYISTADEDAFVPFWSKLIYVFNSLCALQSTPFLIFLFSL